MRGGSALALNRERRRAATTPKSAERARAKPARAEWVLEVARVVRAIPRGETASYSEVALVAGRPGAARAVVQALRVLEGVPWWRVVRADGTLAPQVAFEQARRLSREGVGVVGNRVRTANGTKAPSTLGSEADTLRRPSKKGP